MNLDAPSQKIPHIVRFLFASCYSAVVIADVEGFVTALKKSTGST